MTAVPKPSHESTEDPFKVGYELGKMAAEVRCFVEHQRHDLDEDDPLIRILLVLLDNLGEVPVPPEAVANAVAAWKAY